MRALAEDVGESDVTSRATVPAGTRATATITQKEPGVVYGLDAAEATFLALDPDVRVERLAEEGQWAEPPSAVLRATGDAQALLAGERTALNFLQHLSGIATLTARCVQAVEGTPTQILDTRKTTPGLRRLEKQAVVAGGGTNHRAGLYDMVLVKENHAAVVAQVGDRAKLEASGGVTLDTLRSYAEAGVDWISVGALTHSAPALDLSMTLEATPHNA